MITEASNEDVARLYKRQWKPEPGHIHALHVWAVWDGQNATFGLQPGIKALPQELRDAHPEFAAFITGLEEPRPHDLAVRFAEAVARWVKAGMPVMSASGYAARRAVCDACSRWDAAARFGLGRCRSPGCQCSRLKPWLQTERCPEGKWPA